MANETTESALSEPLSRHAKRHKMADSKNPDRYVPQRLNQLSVYCNSITMRPSDLTV